MGKEDRPINILYVDKDVSFQELISTALPKYGDFKVFTASTASAARDVLAEERINYVVSADPTSDVSKTLQSTLAERDNVTPLRITITSTETETAVVTASAENRDLQDKSIPKPFVELVERIEILIGKRCVGYQLRPRSYSIHNITGQKTKHSATSSEETIKRINESAARDKLEQPLIILHEATTELMQAETKDEILDIVLAAVDCILQLPAAGIYLWDDHAGVLRPYGATDGTSVLFGDLPVFTGPDSLAWDAFIDGEFRVYDDVKTRQNRYNSETDIEVEIFAPLGEYGLLIAGSTESTLFNTGDLRATQTLAANAVTALDLVNRKRQLTHHQKRLQQRNEQLTTLKRINNVIRDIGQATVTSSTRAEIEETICEKLTEIEPYNFAWIGERTHDNTLQVRHWAGTNGDFLDHLCGDDRESHEQNLPAEVALSTGEVQVTQNIFADESFSPWRKPALNRGFQSAISLPLSHQQTTYGVLEIYSSSKNAFKGEERDAFGELGEMIANSFSAIERKKALISDTQTELELRMSGEDDIFSRTAREADAQLELDTVVSRDDGTWLMYLTATDVEASALVSILRTFTIVESAQQIRGRKEMAFVGVVLTDFELGELLTTHGAKLNTIQASQDETALMISVPEDTDVRTVVTTCQQRYPNLELARRSPEVDDTNLDLETHQLEALTDKQSEALEVALDQGFFAWPRDKTGEEIAEALGVTPPTFHRHVRMGLEALLQETMGQKSR